MVSTLRPLLQVDGKNVHDAAGWLRRAAAIREAFLRTLGPRPGSQRLYGFEIGPPIASARTVRRLIKIEVDRGDIIEAWLLEPLEPSAHLPGHGRVAIAFPPTTHAGKEETAGLEAGRPYRAYGLELAERGWTVLVPEHFSMTT